MGHPAGDDPAGGVMPERVLSTCDACGTVVMAAPTGVRPSLMVHAAGCPLAGRKRCDWCGGPMKAKPRPEAETCQEKCRAARWKWLRGYGRVAPLVAGPRSGTRARSGLQVSYGRVCAVLARRLNLPPGIAEQVVREALSDRQRERLERRES